MARSSWRAGSGYHTDPARHSVTSQKAQAPHKKPRHLTKSSGVRREKHQSTPLDALPRWRIRRRQRILERCVERQPGPPVLGTVVHPDQNGFIRLLLGEVIPAVFRFEL